MEYRYYPNWYLFVAFVFIAFMSYLIIGAVVAIVGGHGYRYVLCHEMQFAALIFLYPWIPCFYIDDCLRVNKRTKKVYANRF